MKIGQVIESNIKKTYFLQKSCGKEGRQTSPDLKNFLKKALYEVKPGGQELSFNIFR